MNKLELRYYEKLKTWLPSAIITPQFRLRVSEWDAPVPVFYTSDFLVSHWVVVESRPQKKYWEHFLYECKDSRRKPHADELIRPKMVRASNPFIQAVILAVWDGKEWSERTIA